MFLLVSWLLLCVTLVAGFTTPPLPLQSSITVATTSTVHHRHPLLRPLFAKKKKKAAGGGGGFGANSNNNNKSEGKPKAVTISADKTSLEKQWDTFVSITDLEIQPKEDENFEVVDIFVRSAGGSTAAKKEGTKWFRIGKACAEGESKVDAALTLQKGLIFWTAVHMRRELVAAGGKSGAASMELGYTVSTMNVGSEEDGPIDEEEDGDEITIAERVSVKDVAPKSFGFRPDWNPPGFTYKRRERFAMKKKTSALEEIISVAE
jgi:hypothetical protein